MFLSDSAIKKFLTSKKIIIEPKPKASDIRLVGVRVYLGDDILVPRDNQTLDLGNPQEIKYKKVNLQKNGYILKPGEFVLGSTREKLKLTRDLVAFIDGRSTIARIGLTIHVSSSTSDGHYDEPRAITLEMKNLGNLNIKIIAGYPIGMFTFSTVMEPIKQKVQSQYNGQSTATAPNFKKDLFFSRNKIKSK